MNKERIIELLQNEAECVRRQDTPKCQRDENGCQCCDLLVETKEILEAYAGAVEILQNVRKVAYICDRQKECMVKPGCADNGGDCKRTQDLIHAKNFYNCGDRYIELDPELLKEIEGINRVIERYNKTRER